MNYTPVKAKDSYSDAKNAAVLRATVRNRCRSAMMRALRNV